MKQEKKKKKKKRKKEESPERERLKEEIAKELDLAKDILERGWPNLTSRETGRIGGHMAKRLRGKQ